MSYLPKSLHTSSPTVSAYFVQSSGMLDGLLKHIIVANILLKRTGIHSSSVSSKKMSHSLLLSRIHNAFQPFKYEEWTQPSTVLNPINDVFPLMVTVK